MTSPHQDAADLVAELRAFAPDGDTMPLAPFVPTAEQERFLAIHAKHVVVKWVWHFKETLLRAYTERGLSAAISREAVDELVTAGLMEWGFGCADCRVTDAGKDMLTNCLMVVR